jgi:integrase
MATKNALALINKSCIKEIDLIKEAGSLRKLSENSRTTYKYQMKAYMDYCKEKTLSQDMDSLLAWIIQTKNSETQTLRLAAAKKVFYSIFKNDPRLNDLKESLEEIKPAVRNRAITESGYLKKKEVDLFMKKAPEQIGKIFGIMFWTGCRISEALNIELSNCQLINNVIEIRIVGKGKKENIVYLSEKFFNECKDFFKSKKYLIEHDGLRYNRSYVNRMITEQGVKILDRHISAHMARHSKAMYLRDVMKLPIDKIQKALNHSNVKTTIDYYLHSRATAKEQGIK